MFLIDYIIYFNVKKSKSLIILVRIVLDKPQIINLL